MSEGQQPTIFALDSSGKTAGVCVLRGGQVLYEENLNEGLTHSERLLPLAIRAFEAAGLAPAGVDVFAVTTGPGSFTGLRIGTSLVKGLALPAGVPAVGVSTLEALARACYFLDAPRDAVWIPALDARRGEVYWAAFEPAGEGGVRRLAEDAAGPATDIAKAPALEGRKHFFVGDGAGICYNINNCDLKDAPQSDSRSSGQVPPIAKGAAFAALWALQNGPPGPAAALRPHYLRLSQAERERSARLEKETCPCQ